MHYRLTKFIITNKTQRRVQPSQNLPHKEFKKYETLNNYYFQFISDLYRDRNRSRTTHPIAFPFFFITMISYMRGFLQCLKFNYKIFSILFFNRIYMRAINQESRNIYFLYWIVSNWNQLKITCVKSHINKDISIKKF